MMYMIMSAKDRIYSAFIGWIIPYMMYMFPQGSVPYIDWIISYMIYTFPQGSDVQQLIPYMTYMIINTKDRIYSGLSHIVDLDSPQKVHYTAACTI